MQGKNRQAWLWRFVVPATFVILWSAGYTFAKMGLAHAGVATLLALRYGLVVIVLLPLFYLLRPPLPTRASDWVHVAVVGFFIQVVFFGFTCGRAGRRCSGWPIS